MEYTSTSAAEMSEAVRGGDVEAEELAESCLGRVEEVEDAGVNAYITVTDELARERVEEVGNEGELAGVPIALKDLRALREGTRHTFGAKPFENFVAPRTAEFVRRLEEEGAVVVGKTNTPEFGHKGVTNNRLVGSTATPFDTSLNSGGSSGGSAAAVASGTVPLATGSDAGGSLRIPTSMCGVVGLKPSFGRIPDDTRPNAYGRETHHTVVGPMARTVEDIALALDVTAGYHPRDPVALPDDGTRYRDATENGGAFDVLDGASVAYSPDLGMIPVEDDVADVVREAVDDFEEAGAEVEEVEMGDEYGFDREDVQEAAWTTFTTGLTGAAELIRDRFGVELLDYEDGLSPSLVEMLEDGGEKTTEEFALTGVVRTEVYDAVQDVFEEHDYLITPTLGVTPFDREADGVEEVAGESVNLYGGWSLTGPFNWTDHPAASVPAGLLDGLPVGMQVVGPRYGDYDVLAACAAFEEVRPWEGIYDKIKV